MIQQRPLLLTDVGRRALKRLRELAYRIEYHNRVFLEASQHRAQVLADCAKQTNYELARRDRWFADPAALS